MSKAKEFLNQNRVDQGMSFGSELGNLKKQWMFLQKRFQKGTDLDTLNSAKPALMDAVKALAKLKVDLVPSKSVPESEYVKIK